VVWLLTREDALEAAGLGVARTIAEDEKRAFASHGEGHSRPTAGGLV
jgi:hypothetical protein